jgi:hypothetical protein
MPIRKKFEDLNNTFNVEIVPETTISEVEVIPPKKDITNIERDISYVFGVLTSTIEKSKEALDGALELAQETDSSRAYEVVGQLVKQTVDSAEKIIDIHKKLKEMDTDTKTTNVTQNNAVFVGTTAEAIKLLKAQIKETE